MDKISEMERAQFMCNECGKDFVDNVKLGLHQYNVHTVWQNLCKQKTGLSNTRKATAWIQRSRRPTIVIYASTRLTPKPTSTTTIKECIKPSGAFWCASCKENPKSFINHQKMTKHQTIHENFHDCNKSFGARQNMKRHMKNVHKARNEMKELKWITHGRKFKWRSNWYWQCTIWHVS